MLRSYIKAAAALTQLLTDRKGVVSFEYVIVAACIVATVGAAFNTGTSDLIGTTLTNAITAVCAARASVMGS
jgi:hypothetical protein